MTMFERGSGGTDGTGEGSRVRGRRVAGSLLAVGLTLLVTSGCEAVDAFTGSQTMRWVGDDILGEEPVSVASYKAVGMFPDLTAPQAAQKLGETQPLSVSKELTTGKGWSVSVEQSPYTTAVRYAKACGTRLSDPERVIAEGKRAFESLGGDSETWTWFTVKDKSGFLRVVAEPEIEGKATWSTGLFVSVIDENGPCVVTGLLMGFEKTGDSRTLDSPYRIFQKARHTDGLDIAGDYHSYHQSWTLGAKGRLVPFWQFQAKAHGVVAVDLGDGLETALDTKSALEDGTSGSGVTK